jgi:hypothetical protein
LDRSIPAAAAAILSFVYQHESAGNYDCISNNVQRKLPKPVTKMTVDEVLAQGPTWKRLYGAVSSAAGAPQIITATLATLKKTMGLKGNEKFDSGLQDRMAYQLLRQRGYDQFMSGQIDVAQFAKNIAQEWASMPVLTSTKNYKGVNISRGASYYAGDGLNASAKNSADAFERVLEMGIGRSKVYSVAQPVQFEGTLNDAQQNLAAANNVKPAPTPIASATKVGAAIASGAAVVGGCSDAVQQVTTYQPIIDLASQIGLYGPAVAGAIVAGVVIVVIARKVWK